MIPGTILEETCNHEGELSIAARNSLGMESSLRVFIVPKVEQRVKHVATIGKTIRSNQNILPTKAATGCQ